MRRGAPPLSRRLAALAASVPDDARRVADVGYDRGTLIAALLTGRPELEVVGVEVQAIAAARFAATHPETARSAATRLRLVTGDGLGALAPGEVEGVVIAGVGACSIVAMLRRAPDVVAALRWLILCPTRFNGVLRPALAEMGLFCAEEALVTDRGRTYEIVLARHGVEACRDPVARRYGPRLFERRDPALRPYLEGLGRAFAAAFANALAAYGPNARPDAVALGDKLRLLDAAVALAADPHPPAA